VIVQTSDTTWQAYNRYGIADVQATAGSLYCGGPISTRAGVRECVLESLGEGELQPAESTRADTPRRVSFSTPNIRMCGGSRRTATRQVHQRRPIPNDAPATWSGQPSQRSFVGTTSSISPEQLWLG